MINIINKNVLLYILIIVIICIIYYSITKTKIEEGLTSANMGIRDDVGKPFYIKKKNASSFAITVEDGIIENDRNIVLDTIHEYNTARQLWIFNNGYIHLADNPTYVITLAGNIKDYNQGKIILYKKWLEHEYRNNIILKDSQSWVLENGWIKNNNEKKDTNQTAIDPNISVIQVKTQSVNNGDQIPLSINKLESYDASIKANQQFFVQNFPGNYHANCPNRIECLSKTNDNQSSTKYRSFSTTHYYSETGSSSAWLPLWNESDWDNGARERLVRFKSGFEGYDGMFTLYPSNRIEMYLHPTNFCKNQAIIFRIISEHFLFTVSFQPDSFKLNFNYKFYKNKNYTFFEPNETLEGIIKSEWDNDFNYSEKPSSDKDETMKNTPIIINKIYKLIIIHSVVDNILILNSKIVDNNGIIYDLVKDSKIDIKFWGSDEKNGISSYMMLGSKKREKCAMINYKNLKYTYERESIKLKNNFISKYSKINIINNINDSQNNKFTLTKGSHKEIVFTKDYYLEFTIWPDQTRIGKWINILHCTISNNMHDYTSTGRLPGVWFHPNHLRLHIVHAFGNIQEPGYNFSINPEYILPNHQNTRVIIICEGDAFKVFLINDRNMIIEKISKKSPRDKRVAGYGRLYTSSPSWTPCECFLTRLTYCTLNYKHIAVTEMKHGDFIALWNPKSKRFIGISNDKSIITTRPMTYDLPYEDNYAKWLITNPFLNGKRSKSYINNSYSFYNITEKRFFIADSSSSILLSNEGDIRLDDNKRQQSGSAFHIIKSKQFENKQYLIKLHSPYLGLYLKMPENINNDTIGNVILANEQEYNEDIKNNKEYLYDLLPVKVKYNNENVYFQIGMGNRTDENYITGSRGFTKRSCKQKCNMDGNCIGISYKNRDNYYEDNSECKLFNTSVIQTNNDNVNRITYCNKPNSGIYYEKQNLTDNNSPLNNISKLGCFNINYSKEKKILNKETRDSDIIKCMESNNTSPYFAMNGTTCFTGTNVSSEHFNFNNLQPEKCMGSDKGGDGAMSVFKVNNRVDSRENIKPMGNYKEGSNNSLSIYNKPVYISLYHFGRLPKGCEIGNSNTCNGVKSHNRNNNWIDKNINVEFETSTHRLGSIKNNDYIKISDSGNDDKFGLYVADNDEVSDLLDQNWKIKKIKKLDGLVSITDSQGFSIAYDVLKEYLYLSNKKNDTKSYWRLIEYDNELFKSVDNTLSYHTLTKNKVQLNKFIYFIKHNTGNVYLNGGSLFGHSNFDTKYYKRKFSINKLDYISKEGSNTEFNDASKNILNLTNSLHKIKIKLLQSNNNNPYYKELEKKEANIMADINKQEDIIKSNPKEIGLPVRNVFVESMDDEKKNVPKIWPWIIIPKTLLRSDREYTQQSGYNYCANRNMKVCSVNELYDYSQLGSSTHNDVWTSTYTKNSGGVPGRQPIVGRTYTDINKAEKLGFSTSPSNKNKFNVACCYNN